MLKKTIGEEKFSVLAQYKELTKRIKELEDSRKEILKELFEDAGEEKILSVTVRGAGVAFAVEKQNSNSVSWKGLAEDALEESLIERLLPKFTTPYEKFLVKI